MRRAVLVAGIFIGWAIGICALPAAASPVEAQKDSLERLVLDPSPSATRQLIKAYGDTKSPYARLWLVDSLYERARRHREALALEFLLKAAEDPHPVVRRRAINSLEVFRFFSPPDMGRSLLPSIDLIVARAEKDSTQEIRIAALHLRQAIVRWKNLRGGRSDGTSESWAVEAGRSRPQGTWSRFDLRSWAGLFLWAVCFHLVLYGWQKSVIELLEGAGEAGAAVLSTGNACRKHMSLMIFPAAAGLVLAGLVGGAIVFGLWGWPMPGASARMASWTAGAAVVLLSAGGICGVCAAETGGWTANFLAHPAHGAGLRRSLSVCVSALPAYLAMAAYHMAGTRLHPFLSRFGASKSERSDFWRWARAGGLALSCGISAALAVRERVGWREAMRLGAKRFPHLGAGRAESLFARAPLNAHLLLPVLAVPFLATFSLLPSLVLLDFRPTQFFGWWFLSDGIFAVEFGIWTCLLVAACVLAVFWSLAGLHAARLVLEKPAEGRD